MRVRNFNKVVIEVEASSLSRSCADCATLRPQCCHKSTLAESATNPLGYSLLGVYPCAIWKPPHTSQPTAITAAVVDTTASSRSHCECAGKPIRSSRLAASSVRAVPYPPQPPTLAQQPPAPDSTTQHETPTTTTSEQSTISIPADQGHQYFAQPSKITTYTCAAQNSIAIPFTPAATTLPVIQNPCVIPVEPCYPSNSCLSVGQCYTSPRYPTVLPAATALTAGDCRCQPEGAECCHAAQPVTPTTPSMLFVPYSIPSFPSSFRGNITVTTSPCSTTTPLKDTKGSRATSPRIQPKQDTSQHYHIFVGDLSPEIDTQTLRDAFAPFGEISDSRVVRDAQTLKSKGYGFVSFIKKSEAESAIAAMNGRWLGSRSIRTNWATRKPPATKADGNPMPLTFDEVYKQSSATNCTVYCGGLINGLTEELVQKTFSPFGTIQEIRVFKDKGYAFIRFSTKESAAHAIVAVHNTDINGQIVKCSWGKESGDPNNIPTNAQLGDTPLTSGTFPFNYGQQMGYWYPQTFQAPTPQLPGQYLQSGGFSLGQFGYHQDFIGRLSMNLSSMWNGIPGQTQLGAPTQHLTAQGATLQQPSNVVAYPVQRFQLADEEWTAPSLLV